MCQYHERRDATELFAAKLNVLMSRAAVRDLNDSIIMIFFGLFGKSQYEELRE